MQHKELTMDAPIAPQPMAQQTQARQSQGTQCPHCGAVNDAESMYCASCGQPLRSGICPNCGSEIDLDADFCETCHRYVKQEVCSFCGAHVNLSDPFCPECGCPRGGIVCPTCHTLNDFSFCKQCGTPLTEEARNILSQMKQTPEYKELVKEARELQQLQKQVPYTSERDLVRDRMNDELRERVLLLLAQDEGVPLQKLPHVEIKRPSAEELAEKKEEVLNRITSLLEKMALPAQPSPAKARNYAMAQKPVGLRLGWVCNWKHAMHSSPCGCAKPQLGGKWVVLGKGQKNNLVNDNA